MAGDQLPVTPLLDVVGSAGMLLPLQYALTALNVGMTFELMVMVRVMLEAHCPTLGVNVYVVVAWLLIAGDQLPVMPLVDVFGRGGIVLPMQYGPKLPKVGDVLPGVTV